MAAEPTAAGHETGWIDRGEKLDLAAGVRLRLDVGNRLLVLRGEWTDISLEDCATYVAQITDRYDKEMRAWLESGFDRGPVSTGSRVIVEIAVHPDTPWIDVFRVIDACWRSACNKVQISVDGLRLNLVLPADSSGAVALPEGAILATVETFGEGEVETDWGDTLIRRPARVLYRVDGEEVAYLERVEERLARAVAAAKGKEGARLFGAASIAGNVPARAAAEVLDVFVEAGIHDVDLMGVLR